MSQVLSLFLICALLVPGESTVGSGDDELDNATNTSTTSSLSCTQCVTTQEVLSIIQAEIETFSATLKPLFPLGSQQNPASSCQNITLDRPSGTYWIENPSNNGSLSQQYCETSLGSRCACESTGGWMRVANFDMSNPQQECPRGFRKFETPKRSCGRKQSGCVSTTFPVNGVEYTRVCGRVIGYQYVFTNAFQPYFRNPDLTLEDTYVDGVSLTHGTNPRKHIWTFAAAVDEARSNSAVCPCTRADTVFTGAVPPFVGQDYFCDTGTRSRYVSVPQTLFYDFDPLWDGKGCGSRSSCCEFNSPPWFCRTLSEVTSDGIELRLCSDENPFNSEDIPLEIVELYIQ